MSRRFCAASPESISHPTDEDLSLGAPAPTPRTKTCRWGPRLGRAAAPDETTILRFRHLLERRELCGKILDTVNWYLDSKGIRISTGTIVDATIVAAPSSTKNSKKERYPQMRVIKGKRRPYMQPRLMRRI
jgi:IS5 family transposase